MRTQHGNRDARFVYQGDLSGVTSVSPGDGLTPGKPLASHGGLLSFVIDVEVPAIAAGANSDFGLNYAGIYTSPKIGFDLIRYSEPIDTSRKLQGRGNLWCQRAVVFQGAGLTGAAQPTQGGGTMAITIRTAAVTKTLWTYSGAIQSGQRILIPSSETAEGVYLGTDIGDDKLELVMSATTQPIVAGRLRVLILAAEI